MIADDMHPSWIWKCWSVENLVPPHPPHSGTLAMRVVFRTLYLCGDVFYLQQLIQVFLSERPNWQEVILFISSIYKHFEVDGISSQKMKPNFKPASDGAYAVESLDALSTKNTTGICVQHS